MRNRAKCKQCEEIIESIHSQDYQLCRCGEIFVDGGKENQCGAKDWHNFIRIDDNDNEVIPQIIDDGDDTRDKTDVTLAPTLSAEERKANAIKLFKNMMDTYDRLPAHATHSPISHYDLQAVMITIYEIVRI